jgi:hypothetical protein
MNQISNFIEKSKTWKFDRRTFIDNKLHGIINQGTIEWHKVDDDNNNYIYQETGKLIINNKSIDFDYALLFKFSGNYYEVFTSGNNLLYKSNINNKSFNKIDNFNIEVELKVIDKNKITFKFDKYNNQQSKIDITNYYI